MSAITAADNQQLREHLDQLRMKQEGVQMLATIRELEKKAHWEGLMASHFAAMESFEPRYVGNRDTDDFANDGEFVSKWHPNERPTALTDFMHGSYEPFWSTNGMLRVLQGISRYLAVSNMEGKSLVKGLADYAVYTGFQFSVEHADKKKPAPDDLIEAVQQEIDDFLKRSDFEAFGQGHVFEESRMWGEQLLHVYAGPGGLPVMREIPVMLLEEPSAKSHRELEAHLGLPESSWTYGVVTDAMDTSQVFGYVFARDPAGQQYDYAAAEDCVHIKLNTPRKVKRGLTDFYPVFKLMRFLNKTMFNMVVSAAMQASIAYIRQWETAAGGVGSVQNMGTTGLPRIAGLDGRMRDDHPPGQIVDTYGASYQSAPMAGNAEGLLEVFVAGYRSVGLFYRMAEYMSTGVADTSNRSTSDTAEQGFIKSTERIQTVYSGSYTSVVEKALAISCKANRFVRWGITDFRELKQFVKVHCEPPEVGTRNRADEATVNAQLIMNRVMSRQTWAEREGLDWDVEKERIAEEDEESLDRQERELEMQSYYQQPGGPGQATEGARKRRVIIRGRPKRTKLVRRTVEHMGPGDHPNGSPQSVHGRRNGTSGKPSKEATDRINAEEIAKIENKFADQQYRESLREVPTVQFSEDTTIEEFLRSQENMGRGAYLTKHTPESLQEIVNGGGKLYLSDDMRVGFIVTGEGDLQNLFNNGGPTGAGRAALVHAIAEGNAKTLDCFDPYLPRLYNEFGFRAYEVWEFDDQYAPDGWDYDKLGRPHVVLMRYQGESRTPADILAGVGQQPKFDYVRPPDETGLSTESEGALAGGSEGGLGRSAGGGDGSGGGRGQETGPLGELTNLTEDERFKLAHELLFAEDYP